MKELYNDNGTPRVRNRKRRSDGIAIHPKYGVNATIPICAFCGEEKNEIALLGASYNDEAPKSMIVNLEPCEKCKEKMNQGLTIIEVESKDDLFPHAWAVIRNEYIDDFLSKGNLSDTDKKYIKESKTMFVEIGFLSKVFGEANEQNSN